MKKIKHFLRDLNSYILIIIGALLASFSVACILLPNDAIDYGTAGIAIIISKMTGFRLSICVLCVVLPFLLIGMIYLGRVFCIKAVIGSVVYMVGLDYFEHIPFSLNTEHFLAVAFGGALLGAGLSLILKFGGCIDGSEILANVIIKKLSDKTGRNYSMNVILIAFNALVYTAAFFLIDRNAALLSLLVYVVATTIIDHFTDHFEAIKQVRIITKKPEEMIRGIREDLGKTCTIMDTYGAIAGENKTLICYVNYFELQKLRELIERFEEPSFTTISTIDEVIR
ncbi:MAG: YitT family protein [Lachnospiraceae bacterium]|nr:YitT family protein [Lachnospiraceae bacterium]